MRSRRPAVILCLTLLLLLLAAVPAGAEDNAGPELTLEEAVRKAILYSDSLEIKELEL